MKKVQEIITNFNDDKLELFTTACSLMIFMISLIFLVESIL